MEAQDGDYLLQAQNGQKVECKGGGQKQITYVLWVSTTEPSRWETSKSSYGKKKKKTGQEQRLAP